MKNIIVFILLLGASVFAEDVMKGVLDRLASKTGRQELAKEYKIEELLKEPDKIPITVVFNANLVKDKKHKVIVFNVRDADYFISKVYILLIYEISDEKVEYITKYIYSRSDRDTPNNDAEFKVISCVEPDVNEIFVEDMDKGHFWYRFNRIFKLKDKEVKEIYQEQIAGSYGGNTGEKDYNFGWDNWDGKLFISGGNWPKELHSKTKHNYEYSNKGVVGKKETKDYNLEYQWNKEKFKYLPVEINDYLNKTKESPGK